MEEGTFGWAISQMQNNSAVYRERWNGKNQWLRIQPVRKNSKMTLPYIYIQTVQGDLVPWFASQTDMLARDWWNIK